MGKKAQFFSKVRQNKNFLVIIIIVISAIIGLIYFSKKETYTPNSQLLSFIEQKMKSFHPYAINECILITRNLGLRESICTIANRRVVLRNEYLNCTYEDSNCVIGNLNFTFSPGDYFSLVVNLQKLDIPFDSYYVCLYSDIPIYETSYPGRNDTIGIHFPSISCSKKFYKKDFHAGVISGFVLDKPGKYTILRVYVFDGNLPENFNFRGNLNRGIKVYEIGGEIRV
jgi:hypothetical protein